MKRNKHKKPSNNPQNPNSHRRRDADAPPRKPVDPDTAKYFSEIAALFDSNEVDAETYPTICANALNETRGKELQLATDPIISHTIERLLQGCDLVQLCAFLRNCSDSFPSIASDKAGSHVVETALKSLATHLHDQGSYSIIEDALQMICKEVVGDAVRVMCCRYGSHVLRSLLCLCKGVSFDSMKEFHDSKRSAAQRMNIMSAQPRESFQPGFDEVFNFVVREMLNNARNEVPSLRVNSHSSFVLQTVLRLLAGDDDELLRAILILIRCDERDSAQGLIDPAMKQDIMGLLEDTASSHLLEVIVKVAPETLYNELLNEVFKGSLYEISSHHCGNFVVQALISSASTRDQVELIWIELGAKIKELLEVGKSGVVASILASCQRLQTRAPECCQALAAAVSSESESSSYIVPHILFLDSYFREKSSWEWPIGDKMHPLGCVMLQTIFKYPESIIQPYVTSITSMEDDQIYQTAKDAGGSHVLEAFLSSEVSIKRKRKIIAKLRDHFGELSMHLSSSFTIEKCFTASNLSLKETIATELLAVQTALTKTRHGPYLLMKLDIDGFAKQPEQWKSTLATKEATYRQFQSIFGPNSNFDKERIQASKSSQDPVKKKRNRDEKSETSEPRLNYPGVDISVSKLGIPKHARGSKQGKSTAANGRKDDSKKMIRNQKSNPFLRNPWKKKTSSESSSVRKYEKREAPVTKLAGLAGKVTLSQCDVQKLLRPTNSTIESRNEPRPFLKKQKS